MANDNYKVYMHIFPNDKKYIGITRMEVKERWANGKGYKHQFVWRAIEKYGWENIRHEILFSNLSKEKAERLEMICILTFKTNVIEYGYNMDNGGNGSNKFTEESRIKMSKIRKGKQTGKDNPSAKRVICITTGEIFETMTEASKRYNLIRRNISRACKNGTACGNLNGEKLYWAYCDKFGNYEYVKRKKYERAVICITTGLKFKSIKEAALYYKINVDSIWACCKGRAKSGGKLQDGTKLVWRYLEDIEDKLEDTALLL